MKLKRALAGTAAARSLRETWAQLVEAALLYRDDAPWWLAAGTVVFAGTVVENRTLEPLLSAGVPQIALFLTMVFLRYVLYAWLFYLGVRQVSGLSIRGLAIRDLRWLVVVFWLPACGALAFFYWISFLRLLPLPTPGGRPPDLTGVFQSTSSAVRLFIVPLFLFVLPLTVHGARGPFRAIWASAQNVASRYLHWLVFLIVLDVAYLMAQRLDMATIKLLKAVGPQNLFHYVPEIALLVPTLVVMPWAVLAITVAYRDAFGVAEEPPAPVA